MLNVHHILPYSILLDTENTNLETLLENFRILFNSFVKSNQTTKTEFFFYFDKVFRANNQQKENKLKVQIRNSVKGKPTQSTKQIILDSMKGNQNIWMIKPVNLNRGRGIELFNSLYSLSNYLYSFFITDSSSSYYAPLKKYKSQTSLNEYMENKPSMLNKKFVSRFIIQKYIENPFLINNRKFDIRIWVLLDHNLKYYIFKYFCPCFFIKFIL